MITEWLSMDPLAWRTRGGRRGCGLLAVAVAAITPTLVAQEPPSPPTPSALVDASPPPDTERLIADMPIPDMTQSMILPHGLEQAVLEKTELYTKVFRVPPDFLTLAFTSASRTHGGHGNPTARDVLMQAGMVFPEGATASINRNGLGSFLTVRNTIIELDRTEQFVASISTRLPQVLRWRSHWTPGSTPTQR